jgi:hypothetical protein
MEDAGQKLKQVRDRLDLTLREVQDASEIIAARHNNDEFKLHLARLAAIENEGTVPSIYRLYSLCAIYRLEMAEVLGWYGVPLGEAPADAASVQHLIETTHLIRFTNADHSDAVLPISDPMIDLRRTTFLSRMIQKWGKLPLALLSAMDLKNQRYGFIGSEDWSMYPLIQPSSLVLIDETRRRIVNEGWTNEFERPIYFLEHRGGYAFGWCMLAGDRLIVQPHPSSPCSVQMFSYSQEMTEIEVIGQVVGVAMRLDQGKRRRARA